MVFLNNLKIKKRFLSLLCILLFSFLALGSTDEKSGSNSTSTTIDLNCKVIFNGTQFIITNNDSFDWTEAKLEINSEGFKSGYILRTPIIKSGQTYTVGAMQFAKGDGEKFNPFTHKPMNLSIWCETPKGSGFYYGGWN